MTDASPKPASDHSRRITKKLLLFSRCHCHISPSKTPQRLVYDPIDRLQTVAKIIGSLDPLDRHRDRISAAETEAGDAAF